MKLATYTPQINRNTINAQVDAPAAQAFANIGQMQGRSLAGIAGAIQGAAENMDSVNVQAASNEYTKRLNDVLYNPDNGLLNTKMQGAEGITQKFEEAERKIRQEVGSQYQFLSAKGNMVFSRMTDNSAAQRYEMVRRHQTQQYNAYRDVTYNNALELNTQTAADNYTMPDVVDENMKEAIASVRMRYADQGEEVIKAQERKAVGGIAQQVINRAYANGNDDAAGSYIEKYGKYMDPNVLTQYSKAVHQRVVSNMTRNTAESLVAKYGNNIGALYDAIYNRGEGGSGYDGNAAVAWFKEQAKNGTNWGVNTCTKGVNAALMAGGGIPGNTWAPTNWEDAKKAGMAFKDRSQLRSGDIVYWWKPGSDKNADDTSHVGIYDAETGMVYQSGTSGFKPISLDAYSVTGFARPQGRGMTREQQDELYNSCIRQVNQQKALRNAQDDEVFDNLEKQLMGLSDAGNVDFNTYTSMVDQIAGADPEMRMKGYRSAEYWWNRVAKKEAPKSLSTMAMDTVTRMLQAGRFESEANMVAFMQSPDHEFSADQIIKARKMWKERLNGEGIFKYPELDKYIAAQIQNEGTKKGKERAILLRQYAIDYINSFRAKEKRDPNFDELTKALSEEITSTKLVYAGGDDEVQFTPLDMTRRGIVNAVFDSSRNMMRVQYRGGNVEYMPIKEFKETYELENNSWFGW